MASASERRFLTKYRPHDFPPVAVAVDLVIFSLAQGSLAVVLIERGEHPFKGKWALPGGFLRETDDSLDAAAARELHEETGLSAKSTYFEQLYSFGDKGRDPRMRVVTVSYYALIRADRAPPFRSGGDAASARWTPVDRLPKLAFDHAKIIKMARERLAAKLDYAPLAKDLVPLEFTIADLRALYETVTGKRQDPGNFRRRFERWLEEDIVRELPKRRPTASKPARLYAFA